MNANQGNHTSKNTIQIHKEYSDRKRVLGTWLEDQKLCPFRSDFRLRPKRQENSSEAKGIEIECWAYRIIQDHHHNAWKTTEVKRIYAPWFERHFKLMGQRVWTPQLYFWQSWAVYLILLCLLFCDWKRRITLSTHDDYEDLNANYGKCLAYGTSIKNWLSTMIIYYYYYK